jgi:hypothetical protein
MAEKNFRTAEEALAISLEERVRMMEESMITDLDQIPPEMLEQARADIRDHIAKTESTQTAER